MSLATLELALRKQRLQMHSALLRDQWVLHAGALKPLFGGADRAREGADWLRRHPGALVAGAVALAVMRPRGMFRWARRAFAAWQLWRQSGRWLQGRGRRAVG
jgi:hypothetical protein